MGHSAGVTACGQHEETTVTSRERVIAAFQHTEPDRTPLFERLIKPPADAVVLGRQSATSFVGEMEIWEREGWEVLMEQKARDTVDLAKLLHFDMICLGTNRRFTPERPKRVERYAWQLDDWVHRYFPESGVVRSERLDQKRESDQEAIERTLAELEVDDPVSFPDDQFFVFRRAKELMEAEGLDLAIYVSDYRIGVAALPPFMLEWFYTAPDLLRRYYDKRTQDCIAYGRKCAELGANVIGLGGDFAGDKGPVIAPKLYREFVVPQIRRQAVALHELGVYVTNTTDGDVWPVIEDFLIATDVDGYGEIDKAAGMELKPLKVQYGDRICFLGNLDIRFTLCSGTPEDARQAMIQCIEHGWGNGGHIVMTSNVVHHDVRPENYLAALEAHRAYFGY